MKKPSVLPWWFSALSLVVLITLLTGVNVRSAAAAARCAAMAPPQEVPHLAVEKVVGAAQLERLLGLFTGRLDLVYPAYAEAREAASKDEFARRDFEERVHPAHRDAWQRDLDAECVKLFKLSIPGAPRLMDGADPGRDRVAVEPYDFDHHQYTLQWKQGTAQAGMQRYARTWFAGGDKTRGVLVGLEYSHVAANSGIKPNSPALRNRGALYLHGWPFTAQQGGASNDQAAAYYVLTMTEDQAREVRLAQMDPAEITLELLFTLDTVQQSADRQGTPSDLVAGLKVKVAGYRLTPVEADWHYLGTRHLVGPETARDPALDAELGEAPDLEALRGRLAQDKLAPHSPQIHARLVDALAAAGNYSAAVEEVERMKAAYAPGSEWAGSGSAAVGHKFIERAARRLAISIFTAGIKEKSADLVALAADQLGAYLETFGPRERSYELRFWRAEALRQLGRRGEALTEVFKVQFDRPNGALRKKAEALEYKVQ